MYKHSYILARRMDRASAIPSTLLRKILVPGGQKSSPFVFLNSLNGFFDSCVFLRSLEFCSRYKV